MLHHKRENEERAIEACIAPQETQEPHDLVCEFRSDDRILKGGPIDYAKMRKIYDDAHPK